MCHMGVAALRTRANSFGQCGGWEIRASPFTVALTPDLQLISVEGALDSRSSPDAVAVDRDQR